MSKPSKKQTVIQAATPLQQGNLVRKLPWIIFILYAIAVVYGVSVHEPWRDEAQAWLLVRDLDIIGLFKILPSEGHPPLWYLLIMPLARLGLPYGSQNCLAALIMIAAIYIFIFKTRLPLLVRLLLPFCYFFFYEYAVLARSYGLIALFISLIIWLYPKRFEQPILFALCVVGLFNTHTLAFSFAFGIAALFIIDAMQANKLKQSLLAFLLMLIGGLYLLPYLAMAKMASAQQIQATNHLEKITNAITGSMLVDGNSLLAIILFLAAAVVLLYRTKSFLLFLAGAAGLFYILGYRYNLGDQRHFGILFCIIIGSYGIADNYAVDKWNIIKENNLPRYSSWLLALIIICQLPQTLGRYKDDAAHEFSGAKSAADFIKENNLQYSILAGQQAWAASALAPYLPGKKIYYAECGRYGTYYIYDSCFLNSRWSIAPEDAVDVVYKGMKDSLGSVIFIFNQPLSPGSERFMDVLYRSPDLPIKKDEAFYIYRFKKVIKQ